jgi:2-dehydro-3-deoxygluconokinase
MMLTLRWKSGQDTPNRQEGSVRHGQAQEREEVFDLVTAGETMAAFFRDGAPERYRLTAVGAESNLAVGMAQLGCRTRWISRLGLDELGRHVAQRIAEYGVEVHTEWDAEHPTGVCVKELTASGTRMRYYRSQSAARRLGPAHLRDLPDARWLHLTGVTPALSATAAELVTTALARRTTHTGRVSLDVNYRPALWPSPAAAAKVLLPLARQADVVFLGDDEAQALAGTCEPAALARQILHRDGQELVLKRGGGPASVVTTSGEVNEPALPAPIVDLTGAGDAFAAGYLTGACWDWPPAARLRLGHFLAARVVGVPGDLGPTVERTALRRLASEVNAQLPSRTMWEER